MSTLRSPHELLAASASRFTKGTVFTMDCGAAKTIGQCGLIAGICGLITGFGVEASAVNSAGLESLSKYCGGMGSGSLFALSIAS